tara:strand:+ start:1970 stop:2293 length:324 start_codon:yes stop_codon:yes gene_type:complete
MRVPEISVKEVKRVRTQGEQLRLVDVREEWERNLVKIDDSIFLPMDQLPLRIDELDKAYKTVVYCHTGIRSAAVTAYLLGQGFEDVSNMVGGIDAWAKEVDPSMPLY